MTSSPEGFTGPWEGEQPQESMSTSSSVIEGLLSATRDVFEVMIPFCTVNLHVGTYDNERSRYHKGSSYHTRIRVPTRCRCPRMGDREPRIQCSMLCCWAAARRMPVLCPGHHRLDTHAESRVDLFSRGQSEIRGSLADQEALVHRAGRSIEFVLIPCLHLRSDAHQQYARH